MNGTSSHCRPRCGVGEDKGDGDSKGVSPSLRHPHLCRMEVVMMKQPKWPQRQLGL